MEDSQIVAIPWEQAHPGIDNPVRNTGHQYLKFVNTAVFSEEARHYLRYGYYTAALFGTRDYNEYWDEQERRCLEGYTVGGVRIPGRYYYFLNFGMMKARPVDPITGVEGERKIITFPRFLDHQYYFFLELEECFAEGPWRGHPMKGLCAFKSRRKGFTYMIAVGVYNYNFNFIPASMSVLAAYEKGYYKVTLDGIHFTLTHINKATDWAKRRDKLDKRDLFRASFIRYNDLGMEIEDGYMSEIRALSFKDDPFKSIGESVYAVGFEEAGKFPGLLDALAITEPTYRDGNIMTGVPLVWGSAGDIEKGSKDLDLIFYNPEPYGFKSYENIYDENATGDCGWFIDDLWYLPGIHNDGVRDHPMVDIHGNSYRDLARKEGEKKRVQKKAGTVAAFNKFITQQPFTPAEGFLRTSGTIFDTITASARLAEITTNKRKYLGTIWRANLYLDPETGKVKYQPDIKNEPLYEFPLRDNKHKHGCIEIFEMPVRDSEGNIDPKRYIAGIDSYDDDASDTNSVGSLLLLDRYTDRIVCHYKGRPVLAKDFHENCRRILLFFNAKANYERKNKGIHGHFFLMKSMNLLCDEPEILRERGVSKSNTFGNNAKGTNPVTPVLQWSNTLMVAYLEAQAYSSDRKREQDALVNSPDQEQALVNNLMALRPVPLLKEIINWCDDPKQNFDDISSFRMLVIMREDMMKYAVRQIEKEKTLARDPYFNKWKATAQQNQASPFSYTQRIIKR